MRRAAVISAAVLVAAGVASSSPAVGTSLSPGPSAAVAPLEASPGAPDVIVAGAGVPPPAGGSADVQDLGADLTFTFDSPTEPWPTEQLADVQAMVEDCYGFLRDLLGPPSPTAVQQPINVRKDTTTAFAGLYFPAQNEISLRQAELHVVCHELAHAFRDDHTVAVGTYEEGMARAAEWAALEALGHPEQINRQFHDAYEAMDDPTVGGTRGNIFGGFNLLLRYDTSGYAWTKVLIEHPTFLADFNASLFTAATDDPLVRAIHHALFELAEAAAPEVEGLPFGSWYVRQGVLNPNPPPGVQLYLRPSDHSGVVFRRAPTVAPPNESLVAGAEVRWAKHDAAGALIDEGTATTNEFGSFDIGGTWPTAIGRIRVSATVTVDDQTVERSVLWAESPTAPRGIHGVSARDVPGTVTVTPVQPSGPPVSVDLAAGAFQLPDLHADAGRFLVEVEYEDGLQPLSRQVNKAAGDYFVRLWPLVDPPPGIVVEPTPPRAFTAVAGGGGAQLTWEAPEDDGGAAVTYYRVHRDGGVIGQQPATLRTYTDTAAAHGATHRYHVTAQNGHGESWRTPRLAVLVDALAPATSMITPSARWTLAPTVSVAWTATGGDVAHHDVQRRVAAHHRSLPSTWAVQATDTTATSASVPVTAGSTACFRSRSEDLHGNVSPFTEGRCTSVPLGAARLTYRGAWTQRSVTQAYGGRTATSSRRGDSATIQGVVADRVALVVTRCPTCGSVAVSWNGQLRRTLSLQAPTTQRRRVLEAFTRPSNETGTLTLRVATSGRPVVIEGVGVAKR